MDIFRILPTGAGGIELYNCGFQQRDPNHTYGPISRNEYILQYMIAGSGKLFVRNKVHTLRAGDIFLLEPNTLLHYQANAYDPYTYYWVGFGGDNAAELLARAGITAEHPVRNVSDPQVEDCMRIIFECGERTDSKSLALAFSEFYRLFTLLLPTTSGGKNTANEIINRAISIFHECYHEELHIGDLCHELGIDRTYFSVLFRRAAGLAPSEYLIHYRISQACKLFATDMSITEIAMACGFPDAANFSVRFKKLTGKTPRQYRHEMIEN